MTSFTFATAGRILFGAGRVSELPGIVAGLGRRPFVCTGSDPRRHAAVLDALPGAASFAIAHEPTMDLVRAGAEAARAHFADVVIGLGGGAVLDAAKVVAALVTNGGDPMDYAEVVGRGQPLTAASLPVIAVPTTSGTGSEVTANGVVTSTEHRVKVSLRSASMLPAVALVDPGLTLGVPPSVTAHAGLDALVQCIEPFVSPFATPLTDGFCAEGIRRAARGLRAAWADGSDLAARTDMSLCSLLSGLAVANGKLGAAHGLAAPLGGLLGAPHGAITAAVMAEVSRANIEALRAQEASHHALDRYAEVGELLTGVRDAEAYLAWFTETTRLLGVRGLGSFGLTGDAVPGIAQAASRASSTRGNPVRLPVERFEEIVRASM